MATFTFSRLELNNTLGLVRSTVAEVSVGNTSFIACVSTTSDGITVVGSVEITYCNDNEQANQQY